MLKAFRYLNPYWLSVLAIVALIFGQVQSELALPDYMSDIVTYGIQYGGVTSSEPEAMRASTLAHMAYFSADAADDYTIISQGDASYEQEYPAVKDQDIAVKKDGASLSDDNRKAFLLVSMLDSEDVLKQMNLSSSDELYAAMDANPAVKEQIMSMAEEKLSGFTEDNIESAAIMAVRNEDTALGMDMEHLQSSYIMKEGGKMLVIAALGSLAAMIAAYLASRTATGAGKTTIVKLLMRFYDLNSGDIRIDGIDTTKLTRQELRSCFGMVLQDAWLHTGTIMDNIRYGRMDASDEEVVKAADEAYVDHFIRTLEDGYQTVIDEESTNISQGQKQLLTIARAFLADPRILILDEATSSVDTRTEILIQKGMEKLMKGRTSFVIAHRLSTIKNADLILCMDHGDIVETGTHE